MADTHVTDEAPAESGYAPLDQFGRALDVWRAQIDELILQLDLAAMDVRQDARSRLEGAENALLAARSRLTEARRDAGTNLEALCHGIEAVLADLKQAYTSAVEALRRTEEGRRD